MSRRSHRAITSKKVIHREGSVSESKNSSFCPCSSHGVKIIIPKTNSAPNIEITTEEEKKLEQLYNNPQIDFDIDSEDKNECPDGRIVVDPKTKAFKVVKIKNLVSWDS